ncbi:MAG: thermonuclease family protein [Archaeoglobaceae archaeon]
MKIKAAIILAVFFAALNLLCVQQEEVYYGYVLEVVDGDTIKVNINGTVEKIRVLGIDCPETRAANDPAKFQNISVEKLDYWGKVAKKFAEENLNGKNVTIKIDPYSDRKDRYGRTLAYVYLEGVDFGALMIQKGLARVYTNAEFSKKAEYLKLQSEAMRSKVGVWSEMDES